MQKNPTIISIIINQEGLYEGDLIAYFRAIMQAPNALHPYHGIRHMLHTMWLAYIAAREIGLTPRAMRIVLIAALFHDYDHTGSDGPDATNIQRAIAGLRKHILPADKQLEVYIVQIIESSHYPHKNEIISTSDAILRDVDIAQGLSPAWIELILFRLAQEKKQTMEQMLVAQEQFLLALPQKFHTSWAKKYFAEKIANRLIEVREMMKVVDNK